MKITHIWSVLCGQSIIDTDSKQISLMNIIEHIDINAVTKDIKNLEKPINVPIRYEVVSFWIKKNNVKDAKGYVDICIRYPDGEEKFLFAHEFSIPENTNRLRTRLKIDGLVVKENGIYNFVVKYKEIQKDEAKEVVILPLEVVVNKKLKDSKTEAPKNL